MHEKHAVLYRRIAEDLAASGGGEAFADQEVAVAVHEIEAGAAAGQAAEETDDDGVEGRLEVLVADPVLEQVTEHIERVGAGGFLLYEPEEALIRRWALFAEV